MVQNTRIDYDPNGRLLREEILVLKGRDGMSYIATRPFENIVRVTGMWLLLTGDNDIYTQISDSDLLHLLSEESVEAFDYDVDQGSIPELSTCDTRIIHLLCSDGKWWSYDCGQKLPAETPLALIHKEVHRLEALVAAEPERAELIEKLSVLRSLIEERE
jgi:hypothetical protein